MNQPAGANSDLTGHRDGYLRWWRTMTARTAGRLAWSICAFSVGLGALGVLLADLNPRAGVSFQEQKGVLTVFVTFVAVGALIVSRRPGNVIGLIYCIAGVAFVLDLFTVQYARYGLFARPGMLPGGTVAGWVKNWVLFPALGLTTTYALLLFPDGWLPSRRWRPIAWLAAFGITATVLGNALWPRLLLDLSSDGSGANPARMPVNPIGVASAEGILSLLFAAGGFALIATMFLSGISLVVRFRRAHGDERMQLKWLTFAAAVIVVGYVAGNLFPEPASIAGDLLYVLLLLIPAATGIAILKYRLYDIDLIINRTLVYGSLTAMLGLTYGGLVAALSSFAGESTLAVAGATLAVAALFQPLRRRVQSFIDRRFYRRKYDAAKTLEVFSTRLRDESDIESLTAELLTVIQQTMQLAHASLWLRALEPER